MQTLTKRFLSASISWQACKLNYCYIVICWFMQKYTYIYWIHTDAMIMTQEDFFIKYMYLSLYCKGSKRVTQCLRVRGSWKPNRTAIFWPPLLWPSTLCLSRSPAQLNRRPSSQLDDGFLYCILSTTSLGPKSIGGPEPLRSGVAFPTTSRL